MSILHVQQWLLEAHKAQPIHRDDLGAETSAGGVMHRAGVSPATLQAAPQLAQQLTQEQALVRTQTLQNVPKMAPPSMGPGGMQGLNQSMAPRPPRGSSDQNS